jgi:hypothetical protein
LVDVAKGNTHVALLTSGGGTNVASGRSRLGRGGAWVCQARLCWRIGDAAARLDGGAVPESVCQGNADRCATKQERSVATECEFVG